jgi:polysaccharide chain length determinant protein (PEP-CTERM system associated)
MNSAGQPIETSPSLLGQYWPVVLRHLPWLAAATFLFWGAGITLSLVLPSKFRSETVVLIEQPKVLPQYVAPNVSIDLQQRMQSLSQQILSRTRLVKIMDTFHLYGKRPGEAATEVMVQRMRNDITIDLIKSGGHGDDLSAFKVAFSASRPDLAQQVAGQITSLFIEENLHNEQQLSEDTTAFLENQLNEARMDLERQEQLLGEFRSKHIGELPEQLTSNVQILSGLQARLQAATVALHQAEQQGLYLASMIGQSRAVHQDAHQDTPDEESVISSPNTSLDDQIDKMKADLADLSTRYTPEHPDVVRLKQQIANAEALQRQTEAAKPPGKKTGFSTKRAASRGDQTISAVAQLQSQFKANELEISNRKQEVKALENEIEQYQARLNATPIREQELADISRNHEQSRMNYESLLAKMQQSVMATDLTKRQQGEQFRILDPPSLPQKRYWPNSLQFALLGLVGGFVTGLSGILLKETVDPRVNSEEDLRRWITTTVIATVPPLLTAAERRSKTRRRLLGIAAGTALAVFIPVLTLLTYIRH